MRGAGGGIFKSTNGGGSWSAINAGLQFGSDTHVRALAIDPSTPATLYAGMERGGGAFKSTDGGGSWSAINAGLTEHQCPCPGHRPFGACHALCRD